MIWIRKHPRASLHTLGYIPEFLDETDSRPARDQFNTAYGHGGGWRPFKGHTMVEDTNGTGTLQYPGDPPMLLLFETQLREETIRVYQHAWVAIIQLDGSFEVARLD